MSVIHKDENGQVTWKHQHGDKYVVTGVDRNEKRFPAKTCHSWFHARSYNIWRGHVWLLRDGKRYLLQRVTN